MPPEQNQSSARMLFRNILQGTGYYSLASFASTLSSIVLLPVTTRFLTKADMGALDLLQQITIVVSLLLGLNFSAALGYFYFGRTSAQERSFVLGTMIGGSLLIGAVAGGIGFLAAVPVSRLAFASPDYASFLRVTFIVLPFLFLLEIGLGWLRVENQAKLYVQASLFRIALLLIGTLLVVGLLRHESRAVGGLRMWGVLSSNLISLVSLSLILAVYCLRRYPFAFDGALFFSMVKFAFPLGMSGFAMFIINFGDRFYLAHLGMLSDLGIYTTAYKIGMLISVLYASFHAYWSAQVYQIASRTDADSVIGKTFSYLMLILSFCSLSLMVASKPALQILTARAFWDAAPLVPVIVFAYYTRSIGEFFRCMFLVKGRSGYEAICTAIAAILCLAGYTLLIPRYGVWGAAFATLITFVVLTLISVIWVSRLQPVPVEGARVVKILIAAGAPLAAYFLIPVSSLLAQIGWAALLLLAYPVLLLLLRFPTPAESELLYSLPQRARDFLDKR